MNDAQDVNDTKKKLTPRRSPLAGALALGAFGIALLWIGGVEFPVAVPPGLVILGGGAIVVAVVRHRWTAWLGAGLGLFVLAGFLLSSPVGFEILAGSEGVVAAIGQALEVLGVSCAAVVGTRVALRRD